MEFGIPEASWLRVLYHFYSFKIMPAGVKSTAGTADPFHYLVESIRVFPAPDRVRALMTASGMTNVDFERLTGGLEVLYYAEK